MTTLYRRPVPVFIQAIRVPRPDPLSSIAVSIPPSCAGLDILPRQAWCVNAVYFLIITMMVIRLAMPSAKGYLWMSSCFTFITGAEQWKAYHSLIEWLMYENSLTKKDSNRHKHAIYFNSVNEVFFWSMCDVLPWLSPPFLCAVCNFS